MTVAVQCAKMRFDTLALSLEGKILTIAISRPEVLNALSPQVISELRTVFGFLLENLGSAELGDDSQGEADWSVRGVILTGAGPKAFVAGADIAAMQQMTQLEASQYAADAQELTEWIETIPVPVVAAVNGFALGGGCELAMSCDYIFASENASFGQPEVALGLIPGFGGCVRLQQLVGPAAARELIFTGRRITAGESLTLGLVQRILPDAAALLAAAHESLLLSLKNSPAAVALAKKTMRQVHAHPTSLGLSIERDAFTACFGTAEMLEGTSAFLEKRQASFALDL